MTKQQWHISISKIHKWVGLLLGIQLLFWTVGGLIMTWIPIEQVRGQHKVVEHKALPLSTENLMSISDLGELSDIPVLEVRYYHLMGTPVARLLLQDGSKQILDATTGAPITPISANMATTIASDDFAPNAAVKSVSEINEASPDYRGPFPVWRIDFDDAENSTIYVSPTEARVVARRSSVWRFYDFFWMLHIMDYDKRHNFNNPLVMATSLFAVLFALSGFVLLYFRLHRRDFNFLLGKAK